MPKTYDEFMKDISADELYDRMIQYGMFAEKLPPVFDGASFLAYCKDPSHPVLRISGTTMYAMIVCVISIFLGHLEFLRQWDMNVCANV